MPFHESWIEHKFQVLGPMRVQLLHPVSRFKRVQSLQHLCRYIIVKHVRCVFAFYILLMYKISLKINHRMVHGALWFFGHGNSPILFMMSKHQKSKKVFYFCWLFIIEFSCNIIWKEYSFTNKLQEGPLGFIACAGKDQNLLEHSLLLLGTGNPRELQIRLCIFTFTILFICVLYCWQRKGF